MGKAALEALAFTLAKEERRNGIHVNVVAPGLVETEMGRRLVKASAGVEDIHPLDARSLWAGVQPRWSPPSSASSCPTPPATSPARSSLSTAAAIPSWPPCGAPAIRR